MVSTLTLLAAIPTILIVILVAMALSKWVVIRKHGNNPMIKIPRKRRAVLQNSNEWGSGEVYAILPLSPNLTKATVFMTNLNGQRITRDLHKWDIEPDNPLQALCPTDAALWHVKGTNPFQHNMTSGEQLKLENESSEMRAELHKKDVEKKIIINESFIVPEKMEELIGRMANIGKSGDVIVEKKR